LIIKLLIIGIVLVAGVALIYPEETIQFSKGFYSSRKNWAKFYCSKRWYNRWSRRYHRWNFP